jgi:hypothetical protein
MKQNLNDDTRRMNKCEETPVEKKAGWSLILFLTALVLLLGYFLFS